MDTREWRRRGYIPQAEAARALGMTPAAFKRHVDKGRVAFETQGPFRMIEIESAVAWVRSYFSDGDVAGKHVLALRDRLKMHHDVGAQRERRKANAVLLAASDRRKTRRTKHNHVTRDIKPEGVCPGCDEYHHRKATP